MPEGMNVFEINKYINSAPENELDMISNCIKKVRDNRKVQLRQDLWSNVVAAIEKYCDVTGEDIDVRHPYQDGVICIHDLDNPGIFYVAT